MKRDYSLAVLSVLVVVCFCSTLGTALGIVGYTFFSNYSQNTQNQAVTVEDPQNGEGKKNDTLSGEPVGTFDRQMFSKTFVLQIDGKSAFKVENFEDVLGPRMQQQYERLGKLFSSKPSSIKVKFTHDIKVYRKVANINANYDLVAPSAVAIANNGSREIYVYLGEIDNLVGLSSQVPSLLTHELVHYFQYENYKNIGKLSESGIWFLEGQAEYYALPESYTFAEKSKFTSLAQLNSGLRSSNVETRSLAYPVAKGFYSYLVQESNAVKLVQLGESSSVRSLNNKSVEELYKLYSLTKS